MREVIHNMFRKFIKKHKTVEYVGEYSSFADAEKHCERYDSKTVFDKVSKATLAVINGEAVYERDSYLFYEKSINYNLMFYLQKLYIENGRINLCDVGGAFGSTFLQHREILSSIECTWTVMEQKHFVEYGKKNINIEQLDFKDIPSNENCMNSNYNCILFSGVLQYIENYQEIVKNILKSKPELVIVERTPVSSRGWIWIERVEEPIYDASYAAYVFEENELINMFVENGYRLIDSWKSLVDGDETNGEDIIIFKSYVFERSSR